MHPLRERDQARWIFCGHCGDRLPWHDQGAVHEHAAALELATAGAGVSASAPPSASVRTGTTRSLRVQIAVAALLVALLATSGLAVAQTVKLQRVQRDLAAVQQREAELRASLARANEELARRDQLLKQREEQIAELQVQLEGVRGQVRRQTETITAQARNIEVLKTCLQGVATALVYITANDIWSGVAALQGVQSACERAGRLLR